MIKKHVNPGEEVIGVLTKYFHDEGIQEGAIVSVIGAVDECHISSMARNNAKKDILKKYREPLEMSGNGEIRDGKPHIHCVLGREDNVSISGHLHSAYVKNWFVNVYLIPKE
jgi:predicted DNA-binding protein with PD1-like motif